MIAVIGTQKINMQTLPPFTAVPCAPVLGLVKPGPAILQHNKPVTFLQKFGLAAALMIGAQFFLPPSVTLHAQTLNQARHPNILFIIMDDVGIDQLKSFNSSAPQVTPVLDALAKRGVSFDNCWMMPECSPSRSCFFTGRYPLRTGVRAAILSYNLPSTQVSPYEVTTPEVLARAGYTSAMIGKYHLGGPDNNPAGYGAPASLDGIISTGAWWADHLTLIPHSAVRPRTQRFIPAAFPSDQPVVSAGFKPRKRKSIATTITAPVTQDRNASNWAVSRR
ncbi:MAG: sulfatase-like hydrolase/transferase [Limisphaerales bacterium]